MKSLVQTVLLFVLLGMYCPAKAQTQQAPHLFDAFSNSITCNNTELERIFSFQQGASVQLAFSPNFIFKGNVNSNQQKFSNLQSVTIRSSNFDGALLSISRRLNDDNSITYVGRILNPDYADGYELLKQGSNYILNKIKHADILQD